MVKLNHVLKYLLKNAVFVHLRMTATSDVKVDVKEIVQLLTRSYFT